MNARFRILLLAALFLTAWMSPDRLRLEACDPEPGPHHFARPPIPVPPPILLGCFEVHNTLNGLPANEIRCVLASAGWVMAGSDGGGLMLYENDMWYSFVPGPDGGGFPSRTVTSLAPALDGSVLAGTPAGLVKLRRETRGWRIENNPLGGATSRNLLSLFPTDEGIMAGTDNGAGMIISNALVPFRLEGGILPTGFASCGKLGQDVLFGCSHGLFVRRADMLIPFPIGETDLGWVNAISVLGETLVTGSSRGLFKRAGGEVSAVLPDLWITALGAAPGLSDIPAETPDRSEEAGEMSGIMGTLGSATVNLESELGDSLRQLDELITWAQNPENWSSPEWESKAGRFWSLYFAILARIEDAALGSPLEQPLLKGLWVGTQEDGVILFATDGQRRHFTRENSKLPSNKVTCISTAPNGETWIGTADGGLLRYFRQPVHLNASATPVFAGKVETLKLMGDRLYVGTSDQGLLAFDPSTLAGIGSYTSGDIPGFHRKVTGVGLDPQGRLWVSGDTGVWRIDEKGRTRFPLIDARSSRQQDLTAPLSLAASVLTVDTAGRVFAAAEAPGAISEQVFRWIGDRFVSYSRETIRRALTLPTASAAMLLKELGLTDTWNRQFDAAHASMSLAVYEKVDESGNVSALLDTPNYLLIGTRESGLTIFDGQSFKPLSAKKSGSFGRVVALNKRGNGDLLILGESLGQAFDGETWRPIPAIPGAGLLSDLVFDDLNPDCFWVSWRGEQKGGFALNQGARWISLQFKEPVLKLAVLDPWIFIATPTGVYRLNKR